MCYLLACTFPFFTHCFLVTVPPSSSVGPWGAHSDRLVQRFFCGRNSAAEVPTVTERGRMYVGERKKRDCCVAGEQGHRFCYTPGRKVVNFIQNACVLLALPFTLKNSCSYNV